jgi:hypothetical protein
MDRKVPEGQGPGMKLSGLLAPIDINSEPKA